MSIDDAIKTVMNSVEGKLLDAGYGDAARDVAMLADIEARLRAQLNPQGLAPPPVVPPPPLNGVNMQLNFIVDRLHDQRDDPTMSHCAVFLGAGVHYAPPNDGVQRAPYPVAERPLDAWDLSQVLGTTTNNAGQPVNFAATFQRENAGDLMRVATWHENTSGRANLESRIHESVECQMTPQVVQKRGSEMLDHIASWPCRTFYTTNYDTHLERALLRHHDEIYIWVYRPVVSGETYDLRANWWIMKRNAGAVSWRRWDQAKSALQNGTDIPEPPPGAVVVFKLHGDVRVEKSPVITDDDYTRFLLRITKFPLPRRLTVPLMSTILFIGYSLRDYNMRYVLSLLREEISTEWKALPRSYAVDLRPDPLLRATWQVTHDVLVFLEHNLWHIVPEISRRL